MAYLGFAPSFGEFKKLDNFQSLFNGVTQNFALTSSSVPVIPGTAQNLLIVLNGQLQEPDVAYNISDTSITFATPPTAGTTFFGVLLGSVSTIILPGDGSISTPKLQNYSVTSVKLANTGVTAGTFGNSNGTSIPRFTIGGDGRITFAGNTQVTSSQIVGVSDIQILSNKTLSANTIISGAPEESIFTITDAPAFEINPNNGSLQIITLGANRTPKATNFTSGKAVTLIVDDGSGFSLTWTDTTFGGTGVEWKTNGGTPPALNLTGYTFIALWKIGTQVYGARIGNA